MTEDTLLPFDFPAVRRKKVTADFDGGLISSDGGLVLLREAERRLRLADTLAGRMRDRRDPATVVHTLPAMLCCSASGFDADLRCKLLRRRNIGGKVACLTTATLDGDQLPA